MTGERRFVVVEHLSNTELDKAIEPQWKDLKREILPTIFDGKEHFGEFVTETFLRLSRRLSFANDWIATFFPDIQVLQ